MTKCPTSAHAAKAMSVKIYGTDQNNESNAQLAATTATGTNIRRADVKFMRPNVHGEPRALLLRASESAVLLEGAARVPTL